MDRMPGGGGGPPDGAFERFLTAALATIITIMFSWRLLHEENEASGCSDRDSTPSLTSADFQYHTKARSRYKKLSERRSGTDPSPAGGHYDISLDELDYSDSENSVNISNISNMSVTENNSVREKVTTDSFDPVTAPPLGASPPSINQTTDMSSGHSNLDFPASSADTLTTWDDYDWQEDTGHEQEYVIKTRRSVRNFAKNPKVNPLRNIETNYTETSFESDITPVVNSQVQAEARTHPAAAGNQQFLSLSQRLASFEYSDTGGDSGYVDLYPDVDTDDDDESEEESSDEEHEYEIQISDSDSDSPDERSSSFYGVNTLDTIFEEFESDIEDDIICDTDRDGDICDKGGSNSDKGPFGDETGRYEPDIPLDRESRLDNACGKDKHDAKQTSVNVNDSLTPSGTFLGDLRKQPVQENIQQAVSSARTETSPSNITLNLNPVDEITKHDTLHTVDRDLPTRAETSEYNVSPDFLPVAGDETILNRNVNLDRTENTDSIDLTVNNTGSLNSGIFHKNPLKDKSVIGDLSHITSQDRVSEINVKQRDTENSASRHNASSPSTLQIEFSKLQERMKVPRLDQLQKDHPSTDSSEDNSPSSPVRNIAIDNLADDRFSDTESCSSESVITVISVKSNESDYYPGERGDLTRDSCATPVRTSVDLTAGDRDPLVRTNMSDSSYEHTSLVSGFLNDSLNSLLSANNINDLEGETDVDISKIERQNSSPELTLLEKVEPKLLPGENQQVADDVSEQSESSSKTSSADSLSIELARVQETNQINTELSNQAANSMAADEFRIESRISDALISHDLRILDENDMADRFIGSDSSSDSSDPPLREYDPDDDDLAAFQFNQDCDNDSFYLLVGDEGCLRNYETFTNLDSIGLSSEYNDAFTSRAFPDEASSFTFSRTEDLGTQFRTQTYFTDRRNMSDTDSHSDKGLSPIASDDDEEITCLPEPDPSPVILPLRSEQSEHATTGEKSKIDLLDKYRDAALSQAHDGGVTGTPFTDSLDGNEKKSIDFQKYIIQPERKQDAIKNVDQGGPDSQIGDKDPVGKIDEDFIETKGGEIDNDQCALNISGVNTLNNTVGTNNSRVPQNSSTETADSLLANRDTVKIETDIDSDILCVETDPIKGPCDDYVSDNDAEKVANNDRSVDLISSYISEKRASDRSSKQGRVETNVDELFTESDEKGNGVEAIHKPGKSIQFKKSGRVKLVNRVSKETTIDDFSFVKSDNSSVETNIDEAVPENNVSQLSNEISSRITCETNVDDLFKQPVKSDTPSRLEKGKVNKSRETNIDDIWDDKPTTVNYGEKVSREPVDLTPSKCLIETNVDDIFIDDVIPVKVCPVQSTPMKYAHSLETNVDDVISDKTTHVDEKHTSHRKSVETYVDDLFGDVGLNQEDDVETSSTYAKQENRDASKSNVNKQLSYETFVDDLFSEVLSTEDSCSSLSVDTNVQSSQRAIDGVILSEYTETSTAKEVPISVQTVYSNQHSKSDEFKHPKQIERGVGSDKITDPNRFGQKSLSLKDNSPLDYNSDSEDLNVTNSVYGEDCQNTLPIQQVPSTAKLIDRKIELPDCIEPQICTNAIRDIHSIPTPYGQNNVNSIDTISDGNNVITTENNTNNNVTSLKSKVEEEKAINEHVNNEQLSLECNYDNLKGHKELPVIDHNANVSLPKAGGLNIVRNSDNSSDLGLYPGELNRGARTSPPISVEPTGKRLTLPEVETTAIDSSHDINYGITNDGDIALKIVEDSDSVSVTKSGNTSFEQETFSSIGSCSLNSDDESLSSIEESYHTLQSTYNTARLRGLSDSAIARVVRDHAVKPSVIFRKSKEYQGVKRRVHKHQLKKYSSILQQPIPTEANQGQLPDLLSPEKPLSVNRLKVLQSRQRFLSAENLNTSNSSFEDRFLQYRTSLTSTTPRKYLKRHERALPEMQSTESLPADMSALDFMNSSYGSCSSMDRVHSLPVSHQIEELYQSRYSSTNSSFERHEIDKLHANCMFSPAKREEIRHTTKSLENMFEQLLRYGSVSSSLAETDLDVEVLAQESSFPPDIDISDYVSFQYPLERAASMSALIGPSEGHRLPRKPNKGRFASRNVPKSKSLQTLETNLDDVFAAEVDEFSGELKKVPSVHELRVSNSLSKLNVPDWFRKSSFSRSGSTQSLFTYASRQGSTSTLGSSIYPASITTSPSPSVTPGSNTVIITKRVTATPSTPSTARLIRAPLLPTTPERAPIHNTPSTMSLPSDRFRKNEKKELKPIAIVPFAKLREMFEKKAQENAHSKSKSTPVSSPVRENPPSKVRFESASSVQSRNVTVQSPVRRETTIDNEPVQINRTVSPVPQLPERKPILADSSRRTESAPSNGQPPRKMQVHFSDEKQHVEHVSKPQEQHSSKGVRHNGATPSTNDTNSNGKPSEKDKPVKKPHGFRASLPLPQFRFKRPGIFASKAASSSASSSSSAPQSANSQNKKGKSNVSRFENDNKHDCGYCDLIDINDACVNQFDEHAWLHVLEDKTKIDGETLFEFLQKRRYSSILENGFAEQLEELQDREVAFNFPVVSFGKHSGGEIGSKERSPDLQVVLTNAYSNNSAPYDYMNNKLRNDASMDDILDGLLLLDGHRTGRLRMDEHGRIVPKHPIDFSPDTPPGFTVNSGIYPGRDMYKDTNDNFCELTGSEYMLVTCENLSCKRETNLKEAKQYFKTCHSCFTYYCSRQCRKDDWDRHKKICIYSRINSACKHVIKFINRQPELQYQCSRIARRGYLAQGRGCVMFAFPDVSSSEDFLNYGFDSLWVPPVYVGLRELPNASMLGSKLEILTETCLHYNPELKYVIHVAIVIPPKLPVRPIPRRIESIIQKSAKLRLSPAHMHPRQENNTDIPSTLILTAVPGNQHVDDPDGRKTRELCFINIQRKLRQRDVSLRHQFPDVYNKLIDFVSDAKHFTPMIIYPSDGRTGRKFMCVIMPESEPEIEWIRDPNLFHELDVFEDIDNTSTPNLSLNLQEVLL